MSRANAHAKKSAASESGNERGNEDREDLSIDKLTIACIDRGLTVSDVKKMDLGRILDYCMEYNELHKVEDEKKPKARKATQADWDAFLGG